MARYDIEEGEYELDGARFALVLARFNGAVVTRLRDGALETLKRHGVAETNVDVVAVPGAFELPFMARRMASSGQYEAVITLGAVVRGGTPHFDYVAGECTRGIADASRETGVPVIFGVLTTDDMDQALDRAGGAEGNKGSEAAIAAMDLVTTLRRLEEK